jgi:hypothetical protein
MDSLENLWVPRLPTSAFRNKRRIFLKWAFRFHLEVQIAKNTETLLIAAWNRFGKNGAEVAVSTAILDFADFAVPLTLFYFGTPPPYFLQKLH